MPADSVLLIIFTPSLTGMLFEGEQPESLQEVWAIYRVEAVSEDETTEIGELEEITIGDLPALKISVKSDKEEGVLTVIDFDGEYMIISAVAAVGQFAEHESLIDALLQTMTYSVPEGAITFTSENETLTLDYPGAWTALEFMGTIAVSNDTALLSRDSEDPIESGIVMIFIFRPEVRELPAEDLADAVTQYAELTLQGERLEPGEPVDTTVGEHAAVRLDYETELAEGYLLAVDYDGLTMYIQVQAAVGELTDQEELVIPILESIQYTPAS